MKQPLYVVQKAYEGTSGKVDRTFFNVVITEIVNGLTFSALFKNTFLLIETNVFGVNELQFHYKL